MHTSNPKGAETGRSPGAHWPRQCSLISQCQAQRETYLKTIRYWQGYLILTSGLAHIHVHKHTHTCEQMHTQANL